MSGKRKGTKINLLTLHAGDMLKVVGINPRTGGGYWWVDVEFNGQVHRMMVSHIMSRNEDSDLPYVGVRMLGAPEDVMPVVRHSQIAILVRS